MSVSIVSAVLNGTVEPVSRNMAVVGKSVLAEKCECLQERARMKEEMSEETDFETAVERREKS